MIDYIYEYDQWIKSEYEKQKSNKPFRKKFIGSRGYAHFDTTISLYDAEQIGTLQHLLDPKRLLNWKFLPFLRKDQRNRRFRHSPVLLSPISHRNQKKYTHIKSRPIMYASHHDACLFSFINFIFNQPYEIKLKEHELETNVIAYRSIKRSNNITFAKNVFDYMNGIDEYACLLIDIKGFFDSVPHSQLLKFIESILGQKLDDELKYVMKNILNYRYAIEDEVIKEMKRLKRPYFIPVGIKNTRLCKVEDFNQYINNSKFIRTNKKKYGFPQGSPISGLLANMYLLDFDKWIVDKLSTYSYGYYQRYSDDMLLICPPDKVKDLYIEVKEKINEYGLRLSTEKTELFTKEDGVIKNALDLIENAKNDKREKLQYLGLEWDGNQITLRPSTIGKRYRPKNKLAQKYWKYHEQAISKINQKAIKKQYIRTRRTAKKLVKDK